MLSVPENSPMDDPLQKALGSLKQSIAKRTKKVVQAASIEEQEENLFRPRQPDPSPRNQQDLMAFPFFSLSKNKRIEPIVYEQGNVKVIVRGLYDVGIATIWDADLLIWIASQLNAALEAGEVPTRRLWVIPYPSYGLLTGSILKTLEIAPTCGLRIAYVACKGQQLRQLLKRGESRSLRPGHGSIDGKCTRRTARL